MTAPPLKFYGWAMASSEIGNWTPVAIAFFVLAPLCTVVYVGTLDNE